MGEHSTILLTTNGGDKWSPLEKPLKFDAYLRGVSFADASTGWIVSSVSPAKGVYKTTDGGKTWSPPQKRGDFDAVKALSNERVYVAGYITSTEPYRSRSNIQRTDDGGGSWSDYSRENIMGVKALTSLATAAENIDLSWVVTSHCKIFFTSSDVVGWKEQTFGPDANCTKSSLKGIAVVAVKSGEVNLESSATPEDAIAGVSYVTVIGSNFPDGVITPAKITVSFASDCQGHALSTSYAEILERIDSNSNRIGFVAPEDLPTGTYYVSTSDTNPDDANFASANCSKLNVEKN